LFKAPDPIGSGTLGATTFLFPYRGPSTTVGPASPRTEWDLRRTVRTESSEHWLVWRGDTRIGSLDVHFGTATFGTLVLEEELSESVLEELVGVLDERVASGGKREDFIVSIYHGSDVGMWSDVSTEADRRFQPVTRGDFKDSVEDIRGMVGRGQTARGQLNELVACEFFRGLGYSATLAGNELDHKKIDVVADNDDEIVFCQVKLGRISRSEIAALLHEVGQISHANGKTVAVIAEAFPADIERIRREAESANGVTFWVIHKSQILSALPRFKETLGRG
jgi:hypothetical protein